MKTTLTQIALLAAFAVAGAAHAQKANETRNVPQRAGEASTMTGGAPNAKTSNTATTAKNAASAASGAKGTTSSGKGSASATTNVPDRAGQASTMTNGQPNKKTTN